MAAPQPDGADPSKVLRAAFWMLGSVVAFTLMAIAGRAVSFELDTFEIMMYRSFVGLFIVVIVLTTTGRQSQISRQRLPLHLLRNVFHFAGQNLWFLALALIPLAQVFALEFTTPLWVLLISPLLLGERLTRLRVVCALIGFAGILIVARPNAEALNIGTIAAAAAAIGFAGSIVFTKQLTRTESLLCILFWMTLTQSVFGIICSGYDFDVAVPSLGSTLWLVLIGLGGLAAHFCLTTALSIAPATLITPFDFLRLPIIVVIGMAFYGEPADALVILGAIVIFGANYVNLWSETRKI